MTRAEDNLARAQERERQLCAQLEAQLGMPLQAGGQAQMLRKENLQLREQVNVINTYALEQEELVRRLQVHLSTLGTL